MEARVKATGEIINVKEVIQYDSNYNSSVYYKAENGFPYKKEHLDFEDLTQGKADVKEKSLPKDEPGYWEKLKHQYAGMAMQGMVKTYEQMMRSDIECKMDCCEYVDAEVANGVLRSHAEACAEFCAEFATALVNKLKEERK